MKQVIDNSINDTASWETISELLKQHFSQKKHRDKIAQKLGVTFVEVEEEGKEKKIVPILEKEGKQQYTRWELYNAITEYVTHDEGVSQSVNSYLQETAQKILANRIENLVKVTHD